MTTDVTERIDVLLALADLEPPLAYVPGPDTPPGASTAIVLDAYFAAQPEAYVRELDAWRARNPPAADARCFAFVVSYNELDHLAAMVALYAAQPGADELAVVFVVNYTQRDDAEKTRADERTFRASTELLLALQRQHPFVHVVAKRFSSRVGGLARARKYAMDYALRTCGGTADPDAGVLVANEGDTLAFSDGYLSAYRSRIGTGRERFVQGRVAYPDEIRAAPLLQLYADVRERVHIGQGLRDDRHPGFEGVMPIGRNYAVHPKVAGLAGGIDPVALPSAEDDLTFGFDIYHRLGNAAKEYADDIVVTTHPRREILIVQGLLSGRPDDAQSMYENFHGASEIYDISGAEYRRAIDDIATYGDTPAHRCLVVNHFYQWVVRTVIKNAFLDDPAWRAVSEDNRRHRIGYWEREARQDAIYERALAALPPVERDRFLTGLVDESLAWFNELVAGVACFGAATVALDSRLEA